MSPRTWQSRAVHRARWCEARRAARRERRLPRERRCGRRHGWSRSRETSGVCTSAGADMGPERAEPTGRWAPRSEEHTSEIQSLMRISYAVFGLKKKKNITYEKHNHDHYKGKKIKLNV